MKKFFLISNLILFLILAIMAYSMYFGPIAFLISFACFILAIISSGATKKKVLIAVYVFEGVVSIFIFLANGPFMLDWLIDGINLLQIVLTRFFQIVFLMRVLGLMMNKHARFERFLASKA